MSDSESKIQKRDYKIVVDSRSTPQYNKHKQKGNTMLVDTILAALATMRQRLMRVDGAYTAEQAQQRLVIIGNMRDYVREDDARGFSHYCQRNLEGDLGDLMVDLLDELWEELNLNDDAMWEDFAKQFLEAKEIA